MKIRGEKGLKDEASMPDGVRRSEMKARGEMMLK